MLDLNSVCEQAHNMKSRTGQHLGMLTHTPWGVRHAEEGDSPSDTERKGRLRTRRAAEG